MEYLLGIDIGTYESKGTLVDRSGRIVRTAAVAHETSIPAPGRAEHDAQAVWWHDFATLARELVSGIEPRDVAAVGCSAIGPCVLAVDGAGAPLRPAILYGIDTRASQEVRELTAALGEDLIVRETGSALSSQAAGPKILWLRRHEPEIWKKVARIMTATSWLVYRLTGRVVIDHYTAAAYGPLYSLRGAGWDPRALALVCEESLLPEPAWSASIAGAVTAAAAAETGLAEGTPVTVGTADAAAEAVAAGVLDPGDTMLMYGSTLFFIQICSELPRTRVLWPTVYLEPGTWALAAGMSTAGALTRWLRDQLAPREAAAERAGGPSAYQVLAEEAARVPRGAGGLLVLPYWSGERTPVNDPLARGVVAGLTLAHGRPHLVRAALEGLAFGIRHNLEAMAEAGAAPRRLVAIGGGVRNKLWVRIVSEVTGREQVVAESPGASYGDAMMAAAAAGILGSLAESRRWLPPAAVVRPEAEGVAFYDRRYPLYRELYERTRDLAHALAAPPA